jgi:hypothetical protein
MSLITEEMELFVVSTAHLYYMLSFLCVLLYVCKLLVFVVYCEFLVYNNNGACKSSRTGE